MNPTIDLEHLSAAFTDHPWLAEAVSNGAWWGSTDGAVHLVTPLEDPVELRAGLAALAAALGCEATDFTVARPEPRRPLRARRIGTGPTS